MCGISGWFDIAGERAPDRAQVKAMNDALVHRGPDGEGFYFGPGIAFGHRRLAIIDLVTGDQPMFSADGAICVTFNGEIFNFRELRRELELKGHRFRTASDTEVILHAWSAWGRACAQHLHGQFAFALWDSKQKTLFLARDRLGEKPLYYSYLPDRTLVFGSELKALQRHRGLPRAIDPCAVEEFFALGYIADPRTIYKDVFKLPAGTTLTLVRGRAPVLEPYWDAVPAQSHNSSFDEAAAALLSRLGAATEKQLVADVPVGAFLSGGTDSSAVMALMAKARNEPVSCFTIGFDHPEFDERSYAAEVARRYGGRQFVEAMTGQETDSVELLPGIFDEPFGDSSALPTLHVTRLARRHVKVALSGDAGDELFAGYRRYAFHAREQAMRNLVPDAIRGPVFGLLGRIYPQLDWAPRALRARQTFLELSQDAVHGYFHNLSVTGDALRNQLFSAHLQGALQGYRASDLIAHYMAKAPTDDPVGQAQYVDLKTWLAGDILTKVDRTSMASSLEVRVPMLDHTFVEWALGLPHQFKYAKGQGKRVLKRALEPILPHDLLYRPKKGFSVPLAQWFSGALGTAFRKNLADPNHGLAVCGYFDAQVVDRLLLQHQSGLRDHSRILWLLWMFQRFVEREDSSQAVPATAIA